MFHHPNPRFTGTQYIQLDPGHCRGCWKCIESCPAGVIGKIKMPFHKHVRIDHPERCQGCGKCVKVCPEKAITALSLKKPQNSEVIR